jgi:Protein kinase domain
MPLAPRTRLGPYEILASIGAGGMGEVYKARDTRLDRVVALKIAKSEFSERFDREARAVAALNHPHICQLYVRIHRKEFAPWPFQGTSNCFGALLTAPDDRVSGVSGPTNRSPTPLLKMQDLRPC